MSKHTPGPWIASNEDLRGVYAENGARLVATCHTVTLPESERANRNEVTRANAHLIAAAPQLLAALKSAIPYLPQGLGILAAARDAIATAEGGAR